MKSLALIVAFTAMLVATADARGAGTRCIAQIGKAGMTAEGVRCGQSHRSYRNPWDPGAPPPSGLPRRSSAKCASIPIARVAAIGWLIGATAMGRWRNSERANTSTRSRPAIEDRSRGQPRRRRLMPSSIARCVRRQKALRPAVKGCELAPGVVACAEGHSAPAQILHKIRLWLVIEVRGVVALAHDLSPSDR